MHNFSDSEKKSRRKNPFRFRIGATHLALRICLLLSLSYLDFSAGISTNLKNLCFGWVMAVKRWWWHLVLCPQPSREEKLCYCIACIFPSAFRREQGLLQNMMREKCEGVWDTLKHFAFDFKHFNGKVGWIKGLSCVFHSQKLPSLYYIDWRFYTVFHKLDEHSKIRRFFFETLI